MSFWQKIKFLTSGLAGIFDNEEIDEQKLEELKQKDVLTELIEELGSAMPVLKRVLIDERDSYLSEKIVKTKGKKVVAVVGAGHVNGIIKNIESKNEVDLEEIEVIPPVSSALKWIGWGLPSIIIGSILYIGYDKGFHAAGDNAIYWFFANGIPSAIGAALAFGHPLTILTAFVGAPFTSLTPVIGAGYVAVFVQTYFKPPVVKEFQTVSSDVSNVLMWWKNKLLRILLVFILTGLGSVIGSYIGAFEIIKNLVN